MAAHWFATWAWLNANRNEQQAALMQKFISFVLASPKISRCLSPLVLSLYFFICTLYVLKMNKNSLGWKITASAPVSWMEYCYWEWHLPLCVWGASTGAVVDLELRTGRCSSASERKKCHTKNSHSDWSMSSPMSVRNNKIISFTLSPKGR